MHFIKDTEHNSWSVMFYYRDYTGKLKQKHKRGFTTKHEAKKYADQFILQQEQSLDMDFETFWNLYKTDMSKRLRENTFRTKEYIVELKILPYFGKRQISSISAADIRKWQTELTSQGYSATYLKTINNQLSAIFNYAVRYYNLSRNPVAQAGSMGKAKADEMSIWTVDEFNMFIEAIEDYNDPRYNVAFTLMFYSGIRLGELLALTIGDIDFDNGLLIINKSLQRINRRDLVTPPKTAKSNRSISLPDFLLEELRNYVARLYGRCMDDKLFLVTKSGLEKALKSGCSKAGIKPIRVHDLRHSHASLLISQLGAQPLLVAQRLGHEKVQTTLEVYSHLYPNQQSELANKLDGFVNKKKGR